MRICPGSSLVIQPLNINHVSSSSHCLTPSLSYKNTAKSMFGPVTYFKQYKHMNTKEVRHLLNCLMKKVFPKKGNYVKQT